MCCACFKKNVVVNTENKTKLYADCPILTYVLVEKQSGFGKAKKVGVH